LFFGRPKVKKLVWGSKRIDWAQARKILQRGRRIFVSLGGNFELWNQAVIFLKGSRGK
jgi:hypothetical protein